ncbi:MAG: sulfatase-like hydrolase/transferase, partial [Candidatus Thermoplasmatota archaeon]
DINKKAIEWVSKQKENFFLWLHYMDVHEPYAPPEYENKNEMLYLATKYRDFPNKLNKQEIKKLEQLYDLSIKHTDKEINNLLRQLEKLGKLKDTIIIITADHGEAFGEHNGILGHGGKFVEQLYEEVVHVPLIIYGYKEKNYTADKLVQNIDLAPTICEMAEIPIPPAFFGKSVFESSKTKEIIINSVVKIAYRTQRYKLIFDKKKENESEAYELYDLKNDKEEKNNIYKEKPKTSKKLTKDMINLLEKYRKKDKMLNIDKYVKKQK